LSTTVTVPELLLWDAVPEDDDPECEDPEDEEPEWPPDDEELWVEEPVALYEPEVLAPTVVVVTVTDFFSYSVFMDSSLLLTTVVTTARRYGREEDDTLRKVGNVHHL
jgi:hypothetical protein